MNNDTKKHAVLGISGVSLAAALGWMLLVKPALLSASQLEQTAMVHEDLIAQHASFRSASNEQPLGIVKGNLDNAARVIERAVLESDIGTALHGSLNTIADDTGVTITRIESTGAREFFEPLKGTEHGVAAQSHSVRIECEGTYAAAVRFIEGVRHADPVLRCRTFRFVPTGRNAVRASMEIDSYAFTHVPGLTEKNDQGGAP